VVYRISSDYGESWSDIEVLLRCEDILGDEGRIADPTPVYDSVNNRLCLLYRAATKKSGYALQGYLLKGKVNSDLSIDWDYGGNVNVSEALGENFGPGPSKGVELQEGTLAFSVSGNGKNFIIYTADGGNTWTRGEAAGKGGESDIALTGGSGMMMISRDGNMSEFPRDNHLRFAYSEDLGATWNTPIMPSSLRTPCVMSSVASYGSSLYCAYADSYLTRAKLSYAKSMDGGREWHTTQLYSGASGYTASAISGEGIYLILAEMGKVEYHEEIRLFRITL